MNFHRGTWLAMAVGAVVFTFLNLHAWRPGIGGRSDQNDGVQPHGSELELYYGWPACYRAEMLRSDDPGMGRRVLHSAPFYVPPYSEGWVSSRYVGWRAIVLDVAFALGSLVLLAVILECERREQWTRRATIAVLLSALVLVVAYWTAETVSVHL